MKPHPLDKTSLIAGIIFTAIATLWLVNYLADQPLNLTWIAVGGLVVLALLIVVSVLGRNRSHTNSTSPQEPNPTDTKEGTMPGSGGQLES